MAAADRPDRWASTAQGTDWCVLRQDPRDERTEIAQWDVSADVPSHASSSCNLLLHLSIFRGGERGGKVWGGGGAEANESGWSSAARNQTSGSRERG